ncbi:MAG: hypothetical protein V3R96_02090 [Dehalococcoidales bacterium]
MRIKAAILILAIVGIILAANLLIDNRIMSPPQVTEVQTVCLQCHSAVPIYDTVSALHDKKASFDCSRCHSDSNALKTTDKVRDGLRRLGVGTLLVALTGITTILFITNRKGTVN